MAEETNSKHVLVPQDGSATVSAQADVTEKEINDDRDLIIQRLDAAYGELSEAMKPFQEKWDAGWESALAEAIRDGSAAGISEWGDDFAEIFEKKTWSDLGDKIEKAAGSAYDATAEYAANVYEGMRKRTSDAAQELAASEAPLETLQNWAWKAYDDNVARPVIDAVETSKKTVVAISEGAVTALKIYSYRDKITELPERMVAGDVNWVENFVDTVLKDIDPEMAKAIKQSEGWPIVIEIIQDHESILSYLAYAGLMFETVPPNFYAYVASKGSAYLIVEVILLVITALLSAGTATAARLTTLAARIATSSSKVAAVAKKIHNIQRSFDAFVRTLEDFAHAADELHALGDKLRRARVRGLRVSGGTKTTVAAKRQLIKRDRKCRICGSTKHTTPHGRPGTVKYE